MKLFRMHPVALTGFLLAAAVTLFFLIRITASAIYWSDPAHHNETVKAWMTMGYVAQSWHLDPARIDMLAGLPSPKDHGPWTIEQIAEARGVPVEAIIKQVNDAIAVLKQQEDQK